MQTLAELRTIVTALLNQVPEGENKRARMENFADDFGSLVEWLKKLNFL